MVEVLLPGTVGAEDYAYLVGLYLEFLVYWRKSFRMCIKGVKQKEFAHGLFLSVLQSLATTLARGR